MWAMRIYTAEYALVEASHYYILEAHMNKYTLLNNVISIFSQLSLGERRSGPKPTNRLSKQTKGDNVFGRLQ